MPQTGELLLLAALAAVLLRSQEDTSLIQQLQSRHPDAARALYDRFGRIAFSLIYRIVRDHGVAEELLQETFLRVWNRVQYFDPQRGALGAWVLTVARNQAIDYLRSAAGKTARTESALRPLEEPAVFAKADEAYLQADLVNRVKGALEKLNGNQRRVIELAYFEGMSQSEIATAMGEPLGTVKTWARTALRLLREELEQVAAS